MIALEKVWMLVFLYFSPVCFYLLWLPVKNWIPQTLQPENSEKHTHTLPFFIYKFLVQKIFNALIMMIFPSLCFFPQQTILLTLLLLHFFSTHTNSHCNSLAVSILKQRLAVLTTPQEKHLHSSQLKCLLYITEKVVHYIIYVLLSVSPGIH